MIGGVRWRTVRRASCRRGRSGTGSGNRTPSRYMTAALRVLLPSLFGELNTARIEAA